MSEVGQQLIEIVRQKAAENPGHVYQRPRYGDGRFASCLYVQDGAPGCIIGHALWEVGLIDAEFEHSDVNHSPCYAVLDHLGIMVDEGELTWLCAAQSQQDEQYPWGAAVERADDLRAL